MLRICNGSSIPACVFGVLPHLSRHSAPKHEDSSRYMEFPRQDKVRYTRSSRTWSHSFAIDVASASHLQGLILRRSCMCFSQSERKPGIRIEGRNSKCSRCSQHYSCLSLNYTDISQRWTQRCRIPWAFPKIRFTRLGSPQGVETLPTAQLPFPSLGRGLPSSGHCAGMVYLIGPSPPDSSGRARNDDAFSRGPFQRVQLAG